MTEFEKIRERNRINILKSFQGGEEILEKAQQEEDIEKANSSSDLINHIGINSIDEAEDILKGIDDDIFKAHQVGDTTTYQGRTYVCGQTKSGKMGWKVQEKKKRGSGTTSGGGSATTKKTTTASEDIYDKLDTESYEAIVGATEKDLPWLQSQLKSTPKTEDDKIYHQAVKQRISELTQKSSKLSTTEQAQVNALVDGFKISSNKYSDKSKMSIMKTPKGNWALYYDGRSVSIMRGSTISEATAKKAGITIKEPSTTQSSSSTPRAKNGTKRPIGAGTMGVEPKPKLKAGATASKFRR